MAGNAHRTAIVLAALTATMIACTRQPPGIETGVSRELARHRADAISDLEYTLRFEIPAEQDEDIAAEAAIEFALSDASAPLQLDFREDADRIVRLASNGREVPWEWLNEHIVLPPDALRPGSNRIEIEFQAGDGSLNRNPDYLYTLFVPDRARTAFPVFDQPDLKATFELTLVLPADWQAIANAPVASVDEADGRVIYRFARSGPISSYLFSFVAGRFEAVTKIRNGHAMTMLHRETDAARVARNVDAIFDLHAAALDWLEEYTGVPYPWPKLDFALIPSFQYGGMEHVGAIQYRASRLLLDEAATETELLQRASLIAHETAHMWFGNLVTMRWFDDVWTKEVLANFMAAKIVNPSFPRIDHDLNFLVDHYPAAYAIDRSEGANPIRQTLSNLNEAGQLYGPIIYDKAPIMMRQLELLVGADRFRQGMREYLDRYAFGNATWPDLIAILDAQTGIDLAQWSDVWVNTPGRPEFLVRPAADDDASASLLQHDPGGLGRVWPQRFAVTGATTLEVVSTTASTPLGDLWSASNAPLVFNADGLGYGLFPASLENLRYWEGLSDVAKGTELINVHENVLAGAIDDIDEYLADLLDIASTERNQLILELALEQLTQTWISLVTDDRRLAARAELEQTLWQTMLDQTEDGSRRMVFKVFANLAAGVAALERVYDVWSESLTVDGLILSEDDYTELAETLAIRLPDRADEIVRAQLERLDNPDDRRRFEFIAPSLSASTEARDRFFESLASQENRGTESWVVDALENLHDPSRTEDAERYILPSLQLLAEIQATGDIFFPSDWLNATLRYHNSPFAAATVRAFLAERPDYNDQLRMKILQAADMLFRSSSLRGEDWQAVR